MAGDSHGKRQGLESGAAASVARHLTHEALELLAHGVALGFRVPALDVGDDPLVGCRVRANASVSILVPDVHLGREAEEDGLAGLCREVRPWRVHVDLEVLAEGVEKPAEVVGDVAAGPWCDHALVQGEIRIRGDELLVDLAPGSETCAHRAGAERGIEREGSGLELFEREPILDAGEVLAEDSFALRITLVKVDEIENDEPATQLESRFDRVGEPAPGVRLHGEPVDDDLDRVLLLLLQGRHLVKADHRAVDTHAGEPLGLELSKQLAVLTLAFAHDRGEDLEA